MAYLAMKLPLQGLGGSWQAMIHSSLNSAHNAANYSPDSGGLKAANGGEHTDRNQVGSGDIVLASFVRVWSRGMETPAKPFQEEEPAKYSL